MDDRDITCCFTGHRPEKMPWGSNENDPRCRDLKYRLIEVVTSLHFSGIENFVCGMAQGGDFYFCDAVIHLRDNYPRVRLEAAIPFAGQPDRWSRDMRQRYARLLGKCDKTTVLREDYTADCMMSRNRYMVDKSSILVAAYNGSSGGTRNTILYAMRSDLEIVELPIETITDSRRGDYYARG